MLILATVLVFNYFSIMAFLRVSKKTSPRKRMWMLLANSFIVFAVVISLIILNLTQPVESQYPIEALTIPGLIYGFALSGIVTFVVTLLLIVRNNRVASPPNP